MERIQSPGVEIEALLFLAIKTNIYFFKRFCISTEISGQLFKERPAGVPDAPVGQGNGITDNDL